MCSDETKLHQTEAQMLVLIQRNASLYMGRFVNIFVGGTAVHINVCDTSVAVKCLFIF